MAASPRHAITKTRKQRAKKGRDKCWVPGCDNTRGLKSFPGRSQDVFLFLRLKKPAAVGPDLVYPTKHNKLCQWCCPTLPSFPILGARVAVLTPQDTFATGVICDLGRDGINASNPAQPLEMETPWRIKFDAAPPPRTNSYLSTEGVEAASKLHRACIALQSAASETNLERLETRINTLHHSNSRAVSKIAELRASLASQVVSNDVCEVSTQTDWFSTRSSHALVDVLPTFKKRPSAADVVSRAHELGLVYDPQPNYLNPVVGWPIMELGSFANMVPNYFKLPQRINLFPCRFGFKTMEAAMEVYDSVEALMGPFSGRPIIHHRFQFLAALWRMKQYLPLEELAAQFGVNKNTMVHNLSHVIYSTIFYNIELIRVLFFRVNVYLNGSHGWEHFARSILSACLTISKLS